MITQRRLQHLLALADRGHFGRAAEALGISQPALTKSIQALEVELGVTLIDRGHGKFQPTVFGELVIQRGKRWLAEEEDLRREVDLLAGLEVGSIRVALGPYPSVTSGFVSLTRLLARHPAMRITARVANWREIGSQVLARTVDLGLAELSGLEEEAQFASERVARHRGRFFARPGHPLLAGAPASMPQLLAYPWVTARMPPRIARALPQPLGAAGSIDPLTGDFVPAIEVDVLLRLGDFVSGSNALTIASLEIMEADLRAGRVVVVPLAGPPLWSGYGFISLKNRSLAPAARAFMDEVRTAESEFARRDAALAAEFGLD